MSTVGTLRRNERRLALAWLLAGGLLLALAAWSMVQGGAERTVEALDGRWEARLEHGEELCSAGRFEEAALHLELLDRDHPAIFVKHRLDTQRERVLGLLAQCYLALDKKGRALETAERLARFDPRNWKNHFLLAEVAEHFADLGAADKAYARVLELYPSHLQSVSGRITLAFEAGHYADVPPLFEAYLDAWRVAHCTLEVHAGRAEFDLLVDGRVQAVEVVFTGLPELPGADPARVALGTGGHAIRLEGCELIGAPRVGAAGSARTWAVAPDDLGPWVPPGPDDRFVASAESAPSAARAQLSMAAFKPLPAELWAMVEKSYENVLDRAGLAAARARTLVGAPDPPLQLVD